MATYSLTIQKQDVAEDLAQGEITSLVTNITDTEVLTEVFGSGYTDTTTFEFGFDRNIRRTTKVNVLTAKFGDGYEQRLRSGINPRMEEFGVAFKYRSNAEIKVLAAFLDNKTAANFDVVINGETIKVATEQYSTSYENDNAHSLQTNFRRVYEP
jgi:phage-related protein